MSSIEKAIEKLAQTKREEAANHNASIHPVRPDSLDALGDDMPSSQRHSSGTGVKRTGAQSVRSEHIDLAYLRAIGMLTPDNVNNLISEEFRNIKRPLLKNAYGRGSEIVERGNLIMVASALPGEGKTFTSINLAMSIAMEKDRTVLLVDADVSRAGITKTMGFEPGLGLSDYLLDDSIKLTDLLIKTNVPKLTVVSAGHQNDSMTELLASAAMERLVSDLSTKYLDRIIIFDSPPLIVTTEARVLASLVGQIAIVVSADETPQPAVLEALGYLDKSKPVGFILNKSQRSASSSYGYGYGGR